MNETLIDLLGTVGTLVEEARVPDSIRGSPVERDYQSWLFTIVHQGLEERHGGTFLVKCEPDGGGIRAIRLAGTSFWPDLAVGSSANPEQLGIEVKCLLRRGLPGGISQAVGQAFIYRELYERVLIVYVVVEDGADLRAHEAELSPVFDRLKALGIHAVTLDARPAPSKVEHD